MLRLYHAGNYSNISPTYYLGAFHWSDLLMIFGSYRLDVGEVPELEVQTSAVMQDHILAFLKNSSTVTEAVGWPLFEPNDTDRGLILEFGWNDTTVRTITGDYLDGGCWNSSQYFPIHG